MSTLTPGVFSGGVSGAGQALQDHTNLTEPTVAVGSLSEDRATKVTVVVAGLVKNIKCHYTDAMAISTVVESDDGGEVDDEKEENDNRREREESDDEEHEETQEGKKQKLAEEEEEDKGVNPYQWRTKCGIVADGVTWSGNSQCYCDICSGVADSDDEADQ